MVNGGPELGSEWGILDLRQGMDSKDLPLYLMLSSCYHLRAHHPSVLIKPQSAALPWQNGKCQRLSGSMTPWSCVLQCASRVELCAHRSMPCPLEQWQMSPFLDKSWTAPRLAFSPNTWPTFFLAWLKKERSSWRHDCYCSLASLRLPQSFLIEQNCWVVSIYQHETEKYHLRLPIPCPCWIQIPELRNKKQLHTK